MSVLGFFEATINYWEQLEKKTPTRVKEMKQANGRGTLRMRTQRM